MVNVGLYFDLRNPPNGGVETSRLFGFMLEMCEEADRLGCHSIWLTEHHLFDDGYLPQPLTYAAAVAARTRRVRVGTAVLVAPLHKPVEIAEQAAVVDLISAGRLDLGIGAGYRVPEFDLYGADLSRRYEATDACAVELRGLWSRLTPSPRQARLPIWLGYQGPKGARRAGRLGEGLLSRNGELWPAYREGLLEGGHDLSTGRMAGSVDGWVTDDPERDWPMASAYIAAQFDSYRRHMVEGTDLPLPRPVDPEKLRARPYSTRPLSGIVYGTPDEVASTVISQCGDAPVETVFFWASVAGMPEDVVANNVRLVCTELAPRLAGESGGEGVLASGQR
jgi:alkanesulfonate monooxygenase SsuD/methylene tetrahydromethanopterin reductase-like flavin-dependent oxidoreductase (luciferase family)